MRLLVLFAAAVSACAQSPVTAEDALSIPQVSAFIVSPDSIAYAVNSIDWEANRPKLTWTHLKGKLPFDPEGVSNIVWKGSKVAFFRSEKGKTVLHATTSAQGHIRAVCSLYAPNAYVAGAGNRIAWSPDGTHIAFVGTLDPPPPAPDPIVIDRIQYKGRTSLSDNRRMQVFVVDAAPESTPRALTTPTRDSHSVAWGAGAEVIYLQNPTTDQDSNHNHDIYAVHPTTGNVRRITETPGVEAQPTVSPDGKWIAYTATTREITTIDSVAEDDHVWVVPYGGGAARELNRALDRRCYNVRWMPDSKAVVYQAGDHGRFLLYRTDLQTSTTRPLFEQNAAVGGFHVADSGDVSYTLSTPTHPADLYRMHGKGTEKLTQMHESASKTWLFHAPETQKVTSFDKTEIQAFLYLPKAAKSPLILSIHGGPHGMTSYAFSGSFQYWTARGYAVLAVNPRGSSGYGQKFSDGCVNDWGGGDYKDLMAAVDYVLKRYPQIDGNRMGVVGGSYGGFMTNWVITQTDRFRAAVPIASLSNLISFYSTSLYQDLVHAEFNGFPWKGGNFDTLWKWSPLKYVANVKTPTLFLHGEQDNDVHITQAEEMYTALKWRGVPAVMVRYPREGHGLREPKHQLDSLRRIVDWMDRYLQ